MLLQEPTLDVLRDELRSRICRHCRWRPAGSEGLPCNVARPCEAGCPVFHHLPELVRRARLLDPMLREPEGALRRRIEELCRDDPAARATAVCPLFHYQHRIAQIVAEAYGG